MHRTFYLYWNETNESHYYAKGHIWLGRIRGSSSKYLWCWFSPRYTGRTLFNIYWTLKVYSFGNIFVWLLRWKYYMHLGGAVMGGLYALTEQVHPWFSHVMCSGVSRCACVEFSPIYSGFELAIRTRNNYNDMVAEVDVDLNRCECFDSGEILIWHLLLAEKWLNNI